MSDKKVWRIYVPYLTDSIYEVEAASHEEAMQKHYEGESEYLFEGDSYDSDADPEIELWEEVEDNEE
tara:strand:+ start:1784 stop:1984 length:201 start_codon:yes stop_codon:yes gene_type:complete